MCGITPGKLYSLFFNSWPCPLDAYWSPQTEQPTSFSLYSHDQTFPVFPVLETRTTVYLCVWQILGPLRPFLQHPPSHYFQALVARHQQCVTHITPLLPQPFSEWQLFSSFPGAHSLVSTCMIATYFLYSRNLIFNYVYLSVYGYVGDGNCRNQKRALETLELELKVIVNCLM